MIYCTCYSYISISIPIPVFITMLNQHGYLDAADFPSMVFYALMFVVYIVLGLIWSVCMCCSCKDLIRLQVHTYTCVCVCVCVCLCVCVCVCVCVHLFINPCYFVIGGSIHCTQTYPCIVNSLPKHSYLLYILI